MNGCSDIGLDQSLLRSSTFQLIMAICRAHDTCSALPGQSGHMCSCSTMQRRSCWPTSDGNNSRACTWPTECAYIEAAAEQSQLTRTCPYLPACLAFESDQRIITCGAPASSAKSTRRTIIHVGSRYWQAHTCVYHASKRFSWQ
jgi:hypothetical protein